MGSLQNITMGNISLLLTLLSTAWAGKILELQTKTSTDTDSGMNGALTVEICDTSLNCCHAGEIDSDRDDFNKGHVDVFFGGMIRDCDGLELADGAALLIVTHNGLDGWKGDWIRIVLDGGKYLQCPMGFMLDNFESATLSCQ